MTTPQRQAPAAAAERSPDAPTTDSEATVSGPSIHVLRARRLLVGGLVGGGAAAVLALVLFTLLDGTAGAAAHPGGPGRCWAGRVGVAAASGVAAAGVTAATPAALAGLVLLVYNKNADAFPALWPMAIFLTTVAVVTGWILVEIWVFNRLRIGAYDTEYVSPTTDEDQQ